MMKLVGKHLCISGMRVLRLEVARKWLHVSCPILKISYLRMQKKLYSTSTVIHAVGKTETLQLKKILHGSTCHKIEKLTQKFFVYGHGYNSCDRCFALIEKHKKLTSDLYIPLHWKNVIAQAKKQHPKFEVVDMEANDFFWKT